MLFSWPYLNRLASAEAPPQHQVLGVLVAGGRALLGEGQEGGGGDVEQRGDAVGDPPACLLPE